MIIDFDSLIPVAIIVLAILLVIQKKKYEKNNIYILLYSVFYIYIFFVIKETQFPIILSNEMRDEIGQNVFRDANFIPLINLTIYNLRPALLNIIMTIPFGFGICFFIRTGLKKIILLSFGLGLLLELMQLMVALIVGFTFRYVDVNDIIFNTTGAVIGYGLFKLFINGFKLVIDKHDIKLNSFLDFIYNL